jgi:hypothetical protein
MPRKHPDRTGLPGTGITGARFPCSGGDGPTSGRRKFCPSCWGRLGSAPGGLRDRLIVPAGENPRTWAEPAYVAAVAEAEAWLTSGRRGAA